MQVRRLHGVAALATATVLLAGFAGSAEAKTDIATGSAAAAPYKVGIVYSRTGLLAAYGAEYIQGLRYGLAYATKGTMTVNGRKIELTIVDDGTDPVKAVAAGKDLIGKGYKILAGSVSSGVALADGAARRAEQGALHLRPGRHRRDHRHQQVHLPLRSPDLPGREDRGDLPRGRRQERDRLRAGLGLRPRQLRGRQPDRRRAGPQGRAGCWCRSRRRTSRRSPSRSSRRTPTCSSSPGPARPRPAMWRALEQQGAFGVSNKITTGLAERATWSAFGDVARRSTSSRTTSTRRRRTR